jgi:hypothetical protein
MSVNILNGSSDVRDGPPASIRLFERLQGSALVIGWGNAGLTYHYFLHGRVNPILFAAVLCAVSALVFFLVARIGRRGSIRCKWTLIVLSAIGAGPWFALLQHAGAAHLHSALALGQGALQLGSCVLLMAGESRAWFAGREDD